MWPWKLQGLLRPRAGQEILKYTSRSLQIIRISLVERIGPDPLFGLIPQNLLHRRTVIDYGAVGLDDGYAVRGVLHQGAKPALTPRRPLARASPSTLGWAAFDGLFGSGSVGFIPVGSPLASESRRRSSIPGWILCGHVREVIGCSSERRPTIQAALC